MNRRSALRWISIAVCLLATAANPAAASVPLNVSQVSDIAVDEAHGNIYIADANVIAVLNLDGSAKGAIPDTADATDIDLSHDGSAIYVALRSKHAIGVINPVTLTMTTIDLGWGRCPSSIAQVGGVLWFKDDCPGPFIVGLGSVRLADGAVTLGLAGVEGLASAPGLANRLIVSSWSSIGLFDVSRGAGVAPTQLVEEPGSVGELVASPDGSELLTVAESMCGVSGYSTGELIKQTIYPCSGSVAAIAARADGFVAIGTNSYDGGNDVFVFEPRRATVWRTYDLATGQQSIADRGLAFGARDLYIVLADRSTGYPTYRFARVTPRRASRLELRMRASSFAFGVTERVTAHLTTRSTNRTVTIYAQERGRPRVLVTRGVVDANGDFSAAVQLLRNVTFTATFAGDDGNDATQVARSVTVRARARIMMTKVVGRSGAFRLIRSGSDAVAVGAIAPNHAGDCAYFRVDQFYSGKWNYIWTSKCLRIGPRGTVWVQFNKTWIPGAKARVRLKWYGDGENTASSSPWTYLKFVR